MMEVDYWCDAYGDKYREQLSSRELDPNGKPWGLLYALKDLHGEQEIDFSITVVVSIWEEAFAFFRVQILASVNHLNKLTGKKLPTREDLISVAFAQD